MIMFERSSGKSNAQKLTLDQMMKGQKMKRKNIEKHKIGTRFFNGWETYAVDVVSETKRGVRSESDGKFHEGPIFYSDSWRKVKPLTNKEKIEKLTKQLENRDMKIKALEDRITKADETRDRGYSDLKYRIDCLSSENRSLAGRAEAAERRCTELDKTIDGLKNTVRFLGNAVSAVADAPRTILS